MQATIFASDYAIYDPSEGFRLLPGAPSSFGTIYYVTRSAAGEGALGMGQTHLNECGSSYEDGGYKWGTDPLS